MSKESSKTMVKYIAVRDCLYENRYTKRGSVIELPSDVVMNHACFEKVTNETVLNTDGLKVYDASAEAVRSRKIDAVLAGVVRR